MDILNQHSADVKHKSFAAFFRDASGKEIIAAANDEPAEKDQDQVHEPEAKASEAKKKGREKKQASAEIKFAELIASNPDFRIAGAVGNGVDQSAYRWTGASWKNVSRDQLEASALSFLKRFYEDKASSKRAKECVDTALLWLSSDTQTVNWLPQKNASVLGLDDVYLVPEKIEGKMQYRVAGQTKDAGVTYLVPCRLGAKIGSVYDPSNVDPGSLWGRYLDMFFPDQQVRDLLQLAVGSTLTTKTWEKMFWCWGEGKNGKSTLVNLLRVLHPRNIALDVGSLDNRFGFEDFKDDPSLAVCTESPAYLKPDVTERLKALASRDPIPVNRRFARGTSTMRPKASIWMLFNKYPKVSDFSNGLDRKVLLLPFTERAPDKGTVHDYDQKIAGNKIELMQFINWCLRGALRLEELGRFPTEAELPEQARIAKDEASLAVDNVYRFCDAVALHRSASAWTSKSRLYHFYREHCLDDFGVQPVSDSEFYSRVYAHLRIARDERRGVEKQYTERSARPNEPDRRRRAVALIADGLAPIPA